MSAQELITEHLDLWTGAVTKKSSSGRGSNVKVELTGVKRLRELILELAVRGRLVEQDPSEEPAHLILERLESTVKKSKGKPRASCGASQPSLPTGWASFRVGDYLDFQYGKSLPAKQRDDSGGIEVYGSNGVVGFHTKALTEEPCIVVGRKGSAGALNKALGPSWTTDVAYYVQPPQGFDFEFTYLLLQSLHLDQLGKGIKPGVNRNEAYALSASLPPLEEQHRIVQKVDELMALCDRLEQQTSDQLEAHETLVDTLLGTLTQSENATELADNWARLAAHFDTLFTTEQSIDKLKQTILQLAVMGRLVDRVKSDTPVSKTLEMAADEKNKLVREGKIKKPKQQISITATDTPFRIPSHWRWMRFGQLVTDFANGLYKPAKFYSSKGNISLRMFNIQDGSITLEGARRVEIDDKELIQYGLAPGDILINRVNSKELVGKAAIVPDSEEPMVFESMNMRARLLTNFARSRYINLVLRSGFVKHYLLSLAKEAIGQASLNQTQISSIMIPFPPIEEQNRIVQKVDEFMALCDQLKERLNKASETRCQLAESVIEISLT